MSSKTIAVESLRSRIVRAGSWSLFGHAWTQVLRLGSSLILTRLLMPELFGLMALVGAILMVITLLSDIGIRQAVVRSTSGDDPSMLNTAWTMQVVRGGIIWGVCVLIAFVLDRLQAMGSLPADSVYAAPQLPLVLIVGTFANALHGFVSTKLYSADRKLDLRRTTIIEVAALSLQTVATVAMALKWQSVWALVFGGYFSTMLTIYLSHRWLEGPPNHFEWNRRYVREIVEFGRWILASSALFVLANNADRLTLGAWSTQAQLGFYSIALTLSLAVETAATRLFSSVGTPALSEVVRNDPRGLGSALLRMRLPLDMTFVASAGLLFACGPFIVNTIYTAPYAPAGDILRILSFGLLSARFVIFNSAYTALGHPKYLSMLNLTKLIALVVLMFLGNRLWGVQGVYWAIALHGFALVPLYLRLNRRHGLFNLKFELLIFLVWPLAAGAGYLFTLGVQALRGG
jgi:O-antigen/teichoic acid export membrane protein